MKPLTKVWLVAAGYIVAIVVAAAVAAVAVAFHVVATSGPGGPGYSGMYAFFDSLVFLVAFAVAAVPATGAALYFLRPHVTFWRVFSVVAIVLALAGVAAYVKWTTDSGFSGWSGVVFGAILLAPLFALLFVLSGCFAPNRAARLALFIASLMEIAAFASWVITCLIRNC